ncbi:hypothetical protein [Photobacterium kishitanii]|uniref:Uncharacterized protein n=1 Tax=Photobacterium kishitanii TaxID=318456 RepID=A0A2T3KN22_9GAMM|nr:hypothetical protein [Photobacterium kishitanii]PSV01172.1 hypothetical protein C9J27_03875 [Photobacterium kishitanii]
MSFALGTISVISALSSVSVNAADLDHSTLITDDASNSMNGHMMKMAVSDHAAQLASAISIDGINLADVFASVSTVNLSSASTYGEAAGAVSTASSVKANACNVTCHTQCNCNCNSWWR